MNEPTLTDVLLAINGISLDMSGVKGDVGEIKVDVSGLKLEVTELTTGIQGLKIDVQDLKTEVGGIKVDIQDLKTEVHELNFRVGSIDHRLGNVEDTLESLSVAFDADAEKVVDHEKRIANVELRLV